VYQPQCGGKLQQCGLLLLEIQLEEHSAALLAIKPKLPALTVDAHKLLVDNGDVGVG
jgi:hypothetical protein